MSDELGKIARRLNRNFKLQDVEEVVMVVTIISFACLCHVIKFSSSIDTNNVSNNNKRYPTPCESLGM